jgi:predicted ATPase/signal transduction histidine kinase
VRALASYSFPQKLLFSVTFIASESNSMIKLPNYQIIEKISESSKTVVYRGIKNQNRQKVIIKLLRSDYPTLEEIHTLKYEYEISRKLTFEGVVQSLGLETCYNGLMLILKDFEAISLRQFLKTKTLDIKEFLIIAIQLTEIIDKIHSNKIIHKDINPSNIVINAEKLKVEIIDFSIATCLSRETQKGINPNLLEGTLPYIAPEQTGRMNRSVDYRSDFYSLGVTFYEILTGDVPFQATDAMELIYCHIAKKPVSPTILNPKIPQVLSDIVMKLLEKTAEERYQTEQGLKTDLESCLSQFQETGKIESFSLGIGDKSSQLLIPQKLYGREQEVSVLIESFEQICTGKNQMILISGYSGIGKTRLIQEIHKPLVNRKGRLISGKFDQLQRNIPYASIIQAFQDLIHQLLAESSEVIEAWKAQLLNALGNNGQVIIDVIPEVELIIGCQSPVPELSATESQNRFNQVFKSFIHTFCRKSHPLILVLDDLQWADSASLSLIKLLMSEIDIQYFLLIGAYRENEVNSTHPLVRTCEEIQRSGSIIHSLVLQPLPFNTVQQILVDTLKKTDEITELTQLIFNKTQGNPFFLIQLLETLYNEKLLQFDLDAGCWTWKISEIQKIGITDSNLVEIITRNINKLSDETIKVLKFAACIGNQFNLDILAIVNQTSMTHTAQYLWEALQAGLVIPLNNAYNISWSDEDFLEESHRQVSYQFLHDQIQQTAYSLIPENQKKRTHFEIGKLLLKKTNPSSLEENIFNIVNQLNIGRQFLQTAEEHEQLATLNLKAGKKAKASTAYEVASRYLNIGLELLSESSWESKYDLTLALYIEAAEVEYLNVDFERASILIETVLKMANSLLDKIKVYELKIQFYVAQNQMSTAVDTGVKALEILGVYPFKTTSQDDLKVQLPSLKDLDNIPKMTNPEHLAALRLLINISSPLYNTKPELLPSVILTQVNFCRTHGHSALAAYVYVLYGLLLCMNQEDIEAGYYSGQIAIKLLNQFNANEFKCKIYDVFHAFIRPWKDALRKTIDPLIEAVEIGLETGDLECAGYCIFTYYGNLFLGGENLETVEYKQEKYINLLTKLKREYSTNAGKIWRQLTLNLIYKSPDRCKLVGVDFDEEKFFSEITDESNKSLLFIFYLVKTILLYFFREYEQAAQMATLAVQYTGSVLGWNIIAIHNFYYSLSLLAVCSQDHCSSQTEDQLTSQQKQYLQQVEVNQKQMECWANKCSVNYQNKYDFVEAEKARVIGDIIRAMEYYDRAIDQAKEQGYIQESALAAERAFDFYRAIKRERTSRAYLHEAYYGYIRWGATAKARDLEEKYPQLVFEASEHHLKKNDINITKSISSSVQRSREILDFSTVSKASIVLSEEIILENLFDKILKIVMENTGATTAHLILKRSKKWVIEATATLENDNNLSYNCSLNSSVNNEILPLSIINYVCRVESSVVLNNATYEGKFTDDPYCLKNKPKSVFCLPMINQEKIIGILYLENNLASGVFTNEHLEVLRVLSSQMAISLKNALLYSKLKQTKDDLKTANEQLEDYSKTLEDKVINRTLELQDKNQSLNEKTTQLERMMEELQTTQAHLIQTEKMSSLGQLVAGIAHEINNPVSFIYGNLVHLNEYYQELFELIDLYQEKTAEPELQAKCEDIDLEFIKEDIPLVINSMQSGATRIRDIVSSLRNFSRLDEAESKFVNIHEGIESTVNILQYRIHQLQSHSIEIIKEYGVLPKVECYPGQLNQVFMNILTNAVDAFKGITLTQNNINPKISIHTELIPEEKVRIRIGDNGVGMTEKVRSQVFNPFFTTKPVGSGTGLGLSVSYSIIVKQHRGDLRCLSSPGQGSEFIIEIPLKQQKS